VPVWTPRVGTEVRRELRERRWQATSGAGWRLAITIYFSRRKEGGKLAGRTKMNPRTSARRDVQKSERRMLDGIGFRALLKTGGKSRPAPLKKHEDVAPKNFLRVTSVPPAESSPCGWRNEGTPDTDETRGGSDSTKKSSLLPSIRHQSVEDQDQAHESERGGEE